jgi:hypothetical protein
MGNCVAVSSSSKFHCSSISTSAYDGTAWVSAGYLISTGSASGPGKICCQMGQISILPRKCFSFGECLLMYRWAVSIHNVSALEAQPCISAPFPRIPLYATRLNIKGVQRRLSHFSRMAVKLDASFGFISHTHTWLVALSYVYRLLRARVMQDVYSLKHSVSVFELSEICYDSTRAVFLLRFPGFEAHFLKAYRRHFVCRLRPEYRRSSLPHIEDQSST